LNQQQAGTGQDVGHGGHGALRVLFVADGLAYNGAVRMAADLAPRLARAGGRAELFALLPVDERRRVHVDPAVAVTEGSSGRVRVRWELPRPFFRLVGAARRADVVVAVSEVGPGLLLGFAASRLARRPYAVMVHADLPRAVEQWVRPGLRRATWSVHRRADAAICVSKALVAGVVANGVDPGRVHVIPTGVDTHRVRALAAEAPEIDAGEVPRFVGLGRLSVEKGFDVLVRAHASARASGPPHELLLIGEGPQHEPLRRLAAELGVGDSVRLAGFVGNPFPLLAGAAAFVLPSRREGIPLALLEALVLGVPVIASRCGPGVETVLAHGRLGDLVDVDSVPALAAAIRDHLETPERPRAAARAAAEGSARFDLDRTAERLVEILRGLTPERALARRPLLTPTRRRTEGP
jgi:glycosyltransferase involved in cell wall biosynthesis